MPTASASVDIAASDGMIPDGQPCVVPTVCVSPDLLPSNAKALVFGEIHLRTSKTGLHSVPFFLTSLEVGPKVCKARCLLSSTHCSAPDSWRRVTFVSRVVPGLHAQPSLNRPHQFLPCDIFRL